MTSRRNPPSTRVASLNVVAGSSTLDRVVAEIGQDEVAQQDAAVRVRVGAHPAIAGRGLSGQLRQQPAFLVEELLGPVPAHPILEPAQLVRALADARERHLVRAPRSLDRDAVDLAGASPAFRRPEHEHRPARPLELAALPRSLLDLRDRVERAVERGGEAVRAPPATSRRRNHRRRRSAPSRSPRSNDSSSLSGIRASTVGFAIFQPFRCRIGRTAPSRRGLRNLFECQLAASGPVSASPSPTTQATTRSGLSKAAPKACTSA